MHVGYHPGSELGYTRDRLYFDGVKRWLLHTEFIYFVEPDTTPFRIALL